LMLGGLIGTILLVPQPDLWNALLWSFGQSDLLQCSG
jgi:hypothetical protein